MISLTRLNGSTIAINPDLITWIDVTPDTTVSLLGGEKIIVRESLDEVTDKIVSFRRSVGGHGRPPSGEALSLLERHGRKASQRPESAPPRHSSISPIERK